MTTILNVIVDPAFPAHSGIGRYTRELTRALAATAPAGCEVRVVTPAIPEDDLAQLADELDGAVEVSALPVGRRETALAWQSGLAVPRLDGMIHSPSILAPLRKHAERTAQVVPTIHDLLAWSAPRSLPTGEAAWLRSMAKRAQRFADAVVVPSHAVADELAERLRFGDRIRVIGGAASRTLRLPTDADERAERLGLPEHYVLSMGSIDPRKGIRELIAAMARPEVHGLPLLIAGPDRIGEESARGVAAATGLPEDRVRPLGRLSDEDLAVLFSRAALFVYPSLSEGFGLPLVEAFSFGLPVVHSDDPALVEVSAGSGVVVERAPRAEYAERLASAIGAVLDDTDRAADLRVLAKDRSRAFSWRDSAERVWQLHADL